MFVIAGYIIANRPIGTPSEIRFGTVASNVPPAMALIESIGGVILGGLIVGVAVGLAAYFLDPVFQGGVAAVFPFVIMVVILLIRPTGLFGWKTIERI